MTPFFIFGLKPLILLVTLLIGFFFGLEKKKAYELWTRRKPNLKYFRTFGSECYILGDRENLGKFNSKFDFGICPKVF